MKPNKLYDKRITDKSLNELKNFLSWCKKHCKIEPIVIGGWAVYAFVKEIGSIDVDMIVDIRDLSRIKTYLSDNGFEEKENHFSKILEISNKKIEIIFELFTFQEPNTLFENEKIEIPWNLLKENSVSINLEGIDTKVLSIELLMLYKAKALLDRETKILMKTFTFGRSWKIWAQGKIAKDITDIKSLNALDKIDENKINKLLEKTGFTNYYKNRIKKILLK